jgi:hypothetical protein
MLIGLLNFGVLFLHFEPFLQPPHMPIFGPPCLIPDQTIGLAALSSSFQATSNKPWLVSTFHVSTPQLFLLYQLVHQMLAFL